MSTTVDASFISHARIPSQLVLEAVALLDDLVTARTRLIAPILLKIEFASTLRRLHSRGVISGAGRLRLWAGLDSLPIEYVWDPGWIDRALEIAEAAGLSSVYDSIYLACAESFAFELVTCDARFVRAASPVSSAAIRLVDHR